MGRLVMFGQDLESGQRFVVHPKTGVEVPVPKSLLPSVIELETLQLNIRSQFQAMMYAAMRAEDELGLLIVRTHDRKQADRAIKKAKEKSRGKKRR